MRSFFIRVPLVALVLAGVVLEGVLLWAAWPLGVLAGVAGGAVFAVVVGLRLQREWDAPVSARPTAVDAPAEEAAQPIAA